ncbi:hypothetical protein [Methylocystis hirsuta]|uniref:hypothetical protein n=1 Tax=Methylocystis hirsuta TaxID=369798 RepID=UPI003CCA8128
MLARRLGWAAPLPLLATTISHPSMRVANGRRPHPGDPDWSLSVARAYCAGRARGLRVGRRVVAAFRHAVERRAKIARQKGRASRRPVTCG